MTIRSSGTKLGTTHHSLLTTHSFAMKLVLVPVVAGLLLGFPSLASSQGQGQTVPPKSAVPPATKKGGTTPPPAAKNPPPPANNPPPPAAQTKPAGPLPQGLITSDDDPRVKATVARAIANLRTNDPSQLPSGQLALVIHAMAKVREKYPDLVPAEDPQLKQLVAKLRTFCQGGFKPEAMGGHDNYDAGCVAMALAAADAQEYQAELNYVSQYIMTKQKETGAWGYEGRGSSGDTSQTQYAVLGLWEAAAASGLPIPKSVWDRIAQWYIKSQLADGGFEYQAGEGGHGSHTMAVASLGSLYICRDHLPGGKRKNTRGLLMQIQEGEQAKDPGGFRPVTTPDAINAAIEKGTGWLQNHFTLDKATGEGDAGGGPWYYYYLYAFERFGTLAGIKQINGVDWYDQGARLIMAKQEKEGHFSGGYSPNIDTAFAILFLIRSTKISEKIHHKRIGRGTLVSGRGLPQNLADLEQTNSGFKPKALRGSTGLLLDKLETGKPEELEAAALGLIRQRYEEREKWTAIGDKGDKLKKAYERGVKLKSPEVIKFAMKALAETGDYRVVPILIDGMYYEDDAEVQIEARKALCLISRKFNGFGTIYPEEATKEEWEGEIARWKDWYRKVRPESSFEDDVEVGK